MVLKHDFDNMVHFDIHTVIDDSLKQLQWVAVLVMTLTIPIVLTLLIVICGQQFYGLLHLEFLQEAEKEESKLDFTIHENIVLLRVLRTCLHQVRSHHISLIFEHDLRFVLQVTLRRNGIRKVNPGNLGTLRGLQVNISYILWWGKFDQNGGEKLFGQRSDVKEKYKFFDWTHFILNQESVEILNINRRLLMLLDRRK